MGVTNILLCIDNNIKYLHQQFYIFISVYNCLHFNYQNFKSSARIFGRDFLDQGK